MEMTTDHLPCFQNFWISGFLAGSSIQSIRWVFHNNPMFFRWRAFGTDGMGQAGEVDSKVVFYGVPKEICCFKKASVENLFVDFSAAKT